MLDQYGYDFILFFIRDPSVDNNYLGIHVHQSRLSWFPIKICGHMIGHFLDCFFWDAW